MVKWLTRGRGEEWCGCLILMLLGSATPLAVSATPFTSTTAGPDTRSLAHDYSLALNTRSSIPAFARKYGLACSACHTAWPELNAFGQAFRDRGYQLGNDRDSPIWKDPSYWPVTVRITPNWHLEKTDNQPVDATPGDGTSGLVKGTVTQSGFDLSGMDLWFAGTLYKDISFVVLPSSDNTGSFHFEAAFVRFDNLFKSGWYNFKFGKFELDNLISEKRFLFLSGNGGLYQSYHFVPVGDVNNFGLGDNQIGMEMAGHSKNSYTRYGVAVLSNTDGDVGLTTGQSYDAFLTFSHAIDAGKLGVERLGAFGYFGQRPTTFQSSGGAAIPGTGTDNKSFYRVGLSGDFFFGSFELLPFFMHASDDAYLGTGTPGSGTLPAGAQSPAWNSAFLEAHYYVNPQFVFTGRYEMVKMSQQAIAGTPSDLGNINAVSLGWRWYPIMFSRGGLAWHTEFSLAQTKGAPPLSGNGVGGVFDATDWVKSYSVFTGFDFDF